MAGIKYEKSSFDIDQRYKALREGSFLSSYRLSTLLENRALGTKTNHLKVLCFISAHKNWFQFPLPSPLPSNAMQMLMKLENTKEEAESPFSHIPGGETHEQWSNDNEPR
jgi:hypothetical protein